MTGLRVPYTPYGPIPHVNPQVPTTNWRPLKKPWWKDEKYIIGYLSTKPRPVRFINPLAPPSHNCTLIMVPDEETLNQIADRLIAENSNVKNYLFKFGGQTMDMNKKLEENGVKDERDKFLNLGMEEDSNIPAIQLCFNGKS